MKSLKIFILLAAVLLSSCAHYYYVANVQNVPLFREKNELHLSGYYGVGMYSNSIEVQASYSLPYNIGIMANYMNGRGGDVSKNNYGKGNYFEGALGYYKPFEKFEGVLEIYGGMGGGKEHHEYSSRHFDNWEYYYQYDGSSDISFSKLFIQPSFGLTFDMFDVALSTRLNRLSFNNISNNITAPLESDEVNFLSDKSHYFIEPAITLRGGWTYIKFQFQLVYSGYLGHPDFYFYDDIHFSAGLYFTIAKRFKNAVTNPEE
jgi:hypothetical protein